MTPLPRSCAALVMAVLAAVPAVGAQAPTARDSAFLDSVFVAHRHPIAVVDGRLTGPGADFLMRATHDAQFVVVGESHYVAEIPGFTTAWFDALRRARGFQYYAVEYGPRVGELMSAPGVRGDVDAVFRTALRYPHAFQFLDDEELEAFAHVGRHSAARSQPVWGIDNEWGAAHVLDRLVTIAPHARARAAASAMAARAHAVERARVPGAQTKRFISDVDTLEIDRLKQVYGARAGSEAARLLDDLELSNRVYTFNAAAGQALTGYRSNLDREEYMKRQLMRRYRLAERAGDPLPKVLLKVGNVHGGNWRSSTNVLTVGNFVHALATANGMTSFHLVTWLINEPGLYWSLTTEPPYGPLARAGSAREWVVVDFRPLRELAHAGRLPGLSRELRTAIFGFDAVLLIGNGREGTHDRLMRMAGQGSR